MKSLHQILLAAATGFFTVDAGILPPQFLRSLAPRAFAPQTFAPQPPAPVSDTSFSNSSSISIETSAHVSNDDARFSIMSYTRLQSDYNVNNFFDQFNFYTGQDPTNGFVRYIDRASAQAQGLIKNENGRIYIGVDRTNQAPNGRQSVRLESKARYTRGLIVLDLAHMPWGCGTWPAFWTYGDNWPNNGEIDIIEGVHQQNYNSMALHTSDGCSISGSGQTGVSMSQNCFINALGQGTNQGCQTHDYRTNSWGAGFNTNGGGIYATEWNSNFIKIWFFPRGQIPANVYSANPEPASWGTPTAVFQGNCNINQKFNGHKIVFNVTFCGDWAANVWGSSGCSNRAATCNAYVANNPAAFKEAYWMINSLKVWSS